MFGLFKSNIPASPITEVSYNEMTFNGFKDLFFDLKTPALIKNGITNWPLFSKWNEDYIIEHAGNYECTLVSDSRPAASKATTLLKDYFINHKDKSTLSLREFKKGKKPFFFRDIEIPNKLFSLKDIYRYFFFHAKENTGTLPHNHGDAFNLLVFGKKEWVLFDADAATNKEGFELLNQINQKYPVGSHSKDWFKKEVPKLGKRQKTFFHFFQEPGDIVYIPHRYAHAVLNHDNVMGLVIEAKRYE